MGLCCASTCRAPLITRCPAPSTSTLMKVGRRSLDAAMKVSRVSIGTSISLVVFQKDASWGRMGPRLSRRERPPWWRLSLRRALPSRISYRAPDDCRRTSKLADIALEQLQVPRHRLERPNTATAAQKCVEALHREAKPDANEPAQKSLRCRHSSLFRIHSNVRTFGGRRPGRGMSRCSSARSIITVSCARTWNGVVAASNRLRIRKSCFKLTGRISSFRGPRFPTCRTCPRGVPARKGCIRSESSPRWTRLPSCRSATP